MAEKKQQELILDEEALRHAIQKLKEKQPSAEDEMFVCNLPSEMPDRFRKKREE